MTWLGWCLVGVGLFVWACGSAGLDELGELVRRRRP